MKYTTHTNTLLADLMTPLGVYLTMHDRYSQVLLLESSDYASRKDSKSFICFDSLSTFVLDEGKLTIDGVSTQTTNVVDQLTAYLDSFEAEEVSGDGVFGYTGFDAIPHLDKMNFDYKVKSSNLPEIRYDFYRFVIVFDHFQNILTIKEHCQEGQESQIDTITRLLKIQDNLTHAFTLEGEESSNMEDEDYRKMVILAKQHCQRGDVFQVVLSRRFQQGFKGDDINVYRTLRSVNPSPYLFYFDYGSYKIFGSSPEAQLKIEGGVAEIHPIAGTFKRTGDVKHDALQAAALQADPKENAEHVMLVDLARNDLSKHCKDVTVSSYKEVQYFSHVIHLVSKVIGNLDTNVSSYQVFADTFPAGTLSGAPKYKALSLINEHEPTARGFYGGGIGMIGFDGSFNHAIIIRSFLSKHNSLYYQAGAGLVISSEEENELQEVNNKLAALKRALALAENL